MTQTIKKDKLEIDARLYGFVVNDVLPETGISEDQLWGAFQNILEEFIPRNKALLNTRDYLQSQIDAWHIQHKDVDHDPAKYKQILMNKINMTLFINQWHPTIMALPLKLRLILH